MSSLFVCSRCNCLDLVMLVYPDNLPELSSEQLCTFCKTGQWHDNFPRQPYDPAYDQVCNKPTGLSF